MAETRLPAADAIPVTPRIRDVRIESGSIPESTRRGGLRARIDIDPPFESDQKVVTGFDGRGSSWVPFKLADNYEGVGELDIKRMEENAAKLEKDLIMKELETLDFLESLGSTKKIVKDLKLELQQHPVRCMDTPEHLPSQIKEVINERCHRKSPDMIFMELKQASMNLGKTINDLEMIRSYIESLNMKTEKHKDFFGVTSLAEELNKLRSDEDVKMVVETNDTAFHRQNNNTCLKTAEMRLIAARKMEEAARAAEALAIAEMTILSTGKNQDDVYFPEPPRSPLTLEAQMKEDLSIEILKKLEEANEEVKHSQQALETALKRVEIANVKQLEAEDAFRQWNIESWKDQKAIRAKSPVKGSFMSHLNQYEQLIDLPKPVLKRNISVGSVLNWKQVSSIDEKQLVTRRRKFRFIQSMVPKQTE